MVHPESPTDHTARDPAVANSRHAFECDGVSTARIRPWRTRPCCQRQASLLVHFSRSSKRSNLAERSVNACTLLLRRACSGHLPFAPSVIDRSALWRMVRLAWGELRA